MKRKQCSKSSMGRYIFGLGLLSLTLSGCASQIKHHENKDGKAATTYNRTAFIPIAIGFAGLAIAFVAGTAGHAHDQVGSPTELR